MLSPIFSKPLLVLACCLALAACKSQEERAEEYFQSGVELLESGDADRAVVQFRNVFEFDDGHLGARMALGDLFMEQGDQGAAYGQYLRVAEQHPEEFEPRRVLAELAFGRSNWEEFERHGAVAVEMSPEDPRVQAIDIGLKYRAAVLDDDAPARQALTAPSEALLQTLPDNRILNTLMIDSYQRDGSLSKALERLEVLIRNTSDNRQLYMQRLAILVQMQDESGVETQLREMLETFPNDKEVQSMLLRFYISEQRLDEAEAFLREISDPSDEDPGLYVSLITFVMQARGPEAARVEIERAVAENPKPNQFKAMLAMMDFQDGAEDQAIASMEAILANAGPEEEVESIRVTLAKMLANTGNQVGARRLVEETLASNPSNVDALKMQAAWQLLADDIDGAIASLRLVLDTSPEDVQAMNQMYEAYVRLGNSDLAREFLALAVEASGNSPETSVRYARLLMAEDRLLPAEDVLLPALRQNPNNVELLAQLGQLYLRIEDIPRATQVIDTLQRLDSDQARNVANGLQAEVLSQESGTEEALQFLERIANSEGAGLQERLVLLRARLSLGENDEALAIAQQLVTDNPENLGLKQALAGTQLAVGDLAGAEGTLRGIVDVAPAQAANSWLQLMRIALLQGDPDKAEGVLEEGIAATDGNPNLLWAKASRLERDGDIDGAIGIYEALYESNSGSIVVANNLASLLATYRSDAESLERAWVVGRRLREADVPQLQDTYGWILFRRGEVEESLPYLESAAEGLARDPVVQVHLGLAYAALERNAEALEQLQKAVTLAGPGDTREKIEEARVEVQRLRPLVEQ